MKKLTAIVIGYGMRGQIYADYALKHPDKLCIKAVAEPNRDRREHAERLHSIEDAFVFSDWKDLLDTPKIYKLESVGETIAEGHGGGDYGIVRDAIAYFEGVYSGKSVSKLYTSYMNHMMAFAAEESRLTDKVININEFSKSI